MFKYYFLYLIEKYCIFDRSEFKTLKMDTLRTKKLIWLAISLCGIMQFFPGIRSVRAENVISSGTTFSIASGKTVTDYGTVTIQSGGHLTNNGTMVIKKNLANENVASP